MSSVTFRTSTARANESSGDLNTQHREEGWAQEVNFYPYWSNYEIATIVGQRAEALANDEDTLLENGTYPRTENDELDIAQRELIAGHLDEHWMGRRFPVAQPKLNAAGLLDTRNSDVRFVQARQLKFPRLAFR